MVKFVRYFHLAPGIPFGIGNLENRLFYQLLTTFHQISATYYLVPNLRLRILPTAQQLVHYFEFNFSRNASIPTDTK